MFLLSILYRPQETPPSWADQVQDKGQEEALQNIVPNNRGTDHGQIDHHSPVLQSGRRPVQSLLLRQHFVVHHFVDSRNKGSATEQQQQSSIK